MGALSQVMHKTSKLWGGWERDGSALMFRAARGACTDTDIGRAANQADGTSPMTLNTALQPLLWACEGVGVITEHLR